jgi:hypothetical protein
MDYIELPSPVSYTSLHDLSEISSKEGHLRSYGKEVMAAREALMKGAKAIEEFAAQASTDQLNILWQESEALAEPVCCCFFKHPKMRASWQECIKSKIVKKMLNSPDPVINHIRMISKLKFREFIVDKILQKHQKKRILPLPKARESKLSELTQDLPILLVLHQKEPEEFCMYILDAKNRLEQGRRLKLLHSLSSDHFERFITDPLAEKARISKALFSLICLERREKSITDFAQDIVKQMKDHVLDAEHTVFILAQLRNRGQIIPSERMSLSTKIFQNLLPPVRPNLKVVIPPDEKIEGRPFGREDEHRSKRIVKAINKNNFQFLTKLLLPTGTPRTPIKFAITYRELLYLYHTRQKRTKEINALITDITTNHRERLKTGMSALLRDMVVSPAVPLKHLYWFVEKEDIYQSFDEKDADIQQGLKYLKAAKGGLARANAIETWWLKWREVTGAGSA